MGLRYLLLLAFVFGCNKKETVNTPVKQHDTLQAGTEPAINNSPARDVLQARLEGIWTGKGSENSIFEIRPATIYYTDDFAEYPYSLKGDTIAITYPDFTYTAKVSFDGDTLVMKSNEHGDDRYWKFTD